MRRPLDFSDPTFRAQLKARCEAPAVEPTGPSLADRVIGALLFAAMSAALTLVVLTLLGAIGDVVLK